MALSIMCPNLKCKKALVVPQEMRGRRVRCSYCHTQFAIPKHKRIAEPPTPPVKVAPDDEQSDA